MLSEVLLACELLSQQVHLLLRAVSIGIACTDVLQSIHVPSGGSAGATRSQGPVPTTAAIRRYVRTILHGIPSLVHLLPAAAASPAAYLAQAIEAAIAKGGCASTQIVAHVGTISFTSVAPFASSQDGHEVQQRIGIEANLALIRALSQAMAVVACECARATAKKGHASTLPQPPFLPDLSCTFSPEGDSPLGLVAALIAWALEFHVVLEHAFATCAGLSQKSSEPLTETSLRIVVAVLADVLPQSRGGGKVTLQPLHEDTASVGTARSQMPVLVEGVLSLF